MKKLLVLLGLLLPLYAYSQGRIEGMSNDSCLELIWQDEPYGIHKNPDHVKVDTCSGSETHNKYFAKEMFTLDFTATTINLPIPADGETLSDTTWEAVSNEYLETKNALREIEVKYGKYYLRKMFPYSPNTKPAGRAYFVYFDNYVPITDVVQQFNLVPNAGGSYQIRYMILVSSIENNYTQLDELEIYPNPGESSLYIKIGKKIHNEDILIYDAEGKLIKIVKIEATVKQPKVILDTTSLPVGIYIARYGKLFKNFVISR